MFLSSKPRYQQNLLLIFLTLGLFLRIVGIYFFPPGMEGDEVVVVYWGRRWLLEGHWNLLSTNDLPSWETPSAYLFGALDLLGVSPRWGAVLISLIEIGACYLWVRRKKDHPTALVAATFLSLMPWHFYFSYVLGPCVAGLWTSLYLLDLKNPFARIATVCAGLFYYVSFRALLLWGGIVNLWKGRWRELGFDIAGTSLALTVLALLGGDHISGFLFKGSYLVIQRGPLEWAHHYFNSILLWWLPPLQVYFSHFSIYNMDDVGFGFANALGFQSPLSWGTSFFFAGGLVYAFRKNIYKDIVFLFLGTLVLVGFTPSYVHFPFILPVVAFVAALQAQDWWLNKKWGFSVLVLSLVVSLVSVAFVMTRLKSSDEWATFAGRVEKLAEVIPKETSDEKFVWTAGLRFYQARLAGDRLGIDVLSFTEGTTLWLSEVRQKIYETHAHWVFIQATNTLHHPRPEFVEFLKESILDYQRRKSLFEANVNIKNQKAIEVDGVVMGTLYELAD